MIKLKLILLMLFFCFIFFRFGQNDTSAAVHIGARTRDSISNTNYLYPAATYCSHINCIKSSIWKMGAARICSRLPNSLRKLYQCTDQFDFHFEVCILTLSTYSTGGKTRKGHCVKWKIYFPKFWKMPVCTKNSDRFRFFRLYCIHTIMIKKYI